VGNLGTMAGQLNAARVEKVHVERLGARTRLAQAEKFQADAPWHTDDMCRTRVTRR
jgi:hypothetical protein